MTYPFEFNELLLTNRVLDVLGFSEYWAGSGGFGTRSFNGYRVHQIDENEDPEGGYGLGEPQYCSEHFCTNDFHPIYFLHEMYEDMVARCSPEFVKDFIEFTKKKGVNMYPYIESYLKHKP